jgi:glycine dehydrogenase
MTRDFERRHIGPNTKETQAMLQAIGMPSLDELIDKTVPELIRNRNGLNIPAAITEYEYLQHIQEIAARNKVFKTYIGLGYYGTITPSVILRNISKIRDGIQLTRHTKPK